MNPGVFWLLLWSGGMIYFTIVQKLPLKNINLVHFFAIELGTSSDNFIAKFHKIWPFLVKKAQNFNKNVTMTPKTVYIPVLYLAMCAKITKLELKQKKNPFFAQF
jgi:tRNA U34 5-methylaminomethyl-2-thiouridine-forming methyltransferase MnmC